MARVIRRYANRKLYDTAASRYVTLDDLERMIRDGEEVSVRDAGTGDDLTAVVLTEILLRGERFGRAGLPSAFLHQLIKHGQAWQEFMARGLATTLEGLTSSQREANRIFHDWAAWVGLQPAGREATAPSAGPAQRERRGAKKGQRKRSAQRRAGRKG